MNSTGPEPAPAPGDAVASGIRLHLPVLPGAVAQPDDALPAVDLSAIAGARVTLRRGLDAPADTRGSGSPSAPSAPDPTTSRLRLRALCATAPSDRWAPGVEEIVLDRASGIARAAVGGAVERWEGPPPAWIARRFEQRLEGSARLAADEGQAAEPIALRGIHLLGFSAAGRALLCTAVCAEPALPAGAPSRCAPLIDAITLEGELVPPPPPSLPLRAMLHAAEHPLPAAALLCVLTTIATAVLIARRPRPRPVR
ncbi:MAG: hypothetical protein IT372_13130 [Polyangiaceae bacterium]|nr:hypothetical protein [Polyangiaceae bacterium]